MDCFKRTLEIRKCLHELSHIFAWRGIDRTARAQVHHEAGKEALRRAHRLEREMRDVVTHSCNEATHFVARECGEVYVLKDELHVRYILIERSALILKEPHTAVRLIFREREKASEQNERDEDEDE